MGMQRGVPDPYRELGVQRAASGAQIKAAHRRLAKRFHPDAPEGDTTRFLAIQEAYLLLSDPLRRRDWDARHAPGPVRAGDLPRRGATTRSSDGRWTREEGRPSGPRPRSPGAGTRRAAGSRPPAAASGPAPTADARAAHDRSGNRTNRDWSASGRDPSTRSYRWSAENVPWWEDFSPRRSGGSEAAGERRGNDPRAPDERRAPPAGPAKGPASAGAQPGRSSGSEWPRQPSTPPAGGPSPDGRPEHGDVYSRSSGAAWSSAARQYFRKAAGDLPSRGAFVYRGTQVVTGAEAREASEDLLRYRPGVEPAARQVFEPRPADGPRPSTGRNPTQTQPGVPKTPVTHGRTAMRATSPAGGPDSPPPFTATAESRAAEPPTPARSGSPLLVRAAGIGAVTSLATTVPLLVLGSFVLSPPLQPAFAAILLLIAALAGALAAATWARLSR